jgi:hypothetical protein
VDDEISLIEELRRQRPTREEAATNGNQAARDWRTRAAEKDEAEGPAAGESAEPEVNMAAFGYYRGVHERAAHIEFQLLEGPWPAPGYAWLPCPLWYPSGDGKGRGQAMALEYVTGLKVMVRGRNLRPLYERIQRQQVFRVTEMGEKADEYLPEEATVIYAIKISQGTGQGE